MLDEVEGNVDDHVFLTTDHAASTQLEQNVAGVEVVHLGRLLGMAKEAGVHPGVAEAQRFPVDSDRAILQR